MGSLLADYAWYELVSPVTLVTAVLLCYWYGKTIIRSPHYNVTSKHKTYFFSAVILFYLVEGSPFALAADDYLVSALVFQLSTMAFIVAPLFILSFPKAYLKIFFWRHKRSKIAKFLFAHPWPLAVVFNGLVTVFLIPSVFNAVTGNALLQFLYEVLLVTFALLTWWIIIQPSREISDHSYFMRVAYVFFTALFLMPIGIFLLVIQDPMYTSYTAVSGELLPALTAVYDQQLAGGVLKFLQLSSYSVALFYLLKMWGLQEEENEGKVDDDTRVVQGVVIKLNERNRRNKGKKR
ncbi:MAG TPA: cytochrome c oxidase assembly protein [Lentibacillus sp.]|uniref:cytochrome c oxidase assembly protein n=1 Tax=Lentibacillus sp. TaxID=1925746 RepID=UPI002B4B3C33|nr:cytochrome c oxidase assembly protein [Lentibacillus sp.]HLR60939.1 cytochrome c oxidase assembly protein [Lentibacillus sp.]